VLDDSDIAAHLLRRKKKDELSVAGKDFSGKFPTL
jgi:hypothetical protein